MPRLRKLQTFFLLLTIFFFMHLSSIFAAGDSCFQGFSTIPGSVKYAFKWDPTNPEEVNPNSNVEIKVIGGKPPYIWTVNGNGLSLSLDETEVTSNALIADNNACGTATIMVTDDFGGVVTGYVRCITGQWVWVCSGDDSRWSSCWPDAYGNDWVWVWDVKGRYKYHLGMGCHYSPYHCSFSSCEGHTAYIPPDWQGEMCYEGCQSRPQCDDIGYLGCCYGQVKLRVYEWTCP